MAKGWKRGREAGIAVVEVEPGWGKGSDNCPSAALFIQTRSRRSRDDSDFKSTKVYL